MGRSLLAHSCSAQLRDMAISQHQSTSTICVVALQVNNGPEIPLFGDCVTLNDHQNIQPFLLSTRSIENYILTYLLREISVDLLHNCNKQKEKSPILVVSQAYNGLPLLVKRHPRRLKNKMIEAWKKQFSLKQLSLEHDKPITFVVSQWQQEQRPSVAYLFYRWAIAIIFFVTFVISIVDLNHPEATSSFRAKWLIYLTNWGYTTCTLQALFAAFILTVCVLAPYLRSKPNLESSALRWYKLYWVCNTIATDIAFGVTSLYWSLIYDEKSMKLDTMNFFVHANNSILMMIDLFVVAHPIRLLHCCYPIVFGTCYAVFSVIFYAAGGISREGNVYIYNILDWRKPGRTAAVCVAVLGFIVVVHVVCWALHKLRSWLYDRYPRAAAGDDDGLNEKKVESSKAAYVNEGLACDMV